MAPKLIGLPVKADGIATIVLFVVIVVTFNLVVSTAYGLAVIRATGSSITTLILSTLLAVTVLISLAFSGIVAFIVKEVIFKASKMTMSISSMVYLVAILGFFCWARTESSTYLLVAREIVVVDRLSADMLNSVRVEQAGSILVSSLFLAASIVTRPHISKSYLPQVTNVAGFLIGLCVFFFVVKRLIDSF